MYIPLLHFLIVTFLLIVIPYNLILLSVLISHFHPSTFSLTSQKLVTYSFQIFCDFYINVNRCFDVNFPLVVWCFVLFCSLFSVSFRNACVSSSFIIYKSGNNDFSLHKVKVIVDFQFVLFRKRKYTQNKIAIFSQKPRFKGLVENIFKFF